MHLHFTDQHDAIEFGAHSRTYFTSIPKISAGVTAGGTINSQQAEESTKAKADTARTDGTQDDRRDVSSDELKSSRKHRKGLAADQAKHGATVIEALKNGAVNSSEAKYLNREDVRGVVSAIAASNAKRAGRAAMHVNSDERIADHGKFSAANSSGERRAEKIADVLQNASVKQLQAKADASDDPDVKKALQNVIAERDEAHTDGVSITRLEELRDSKEFSGQELLDLKSEIKRRSNQEVSIANGVMAQYFQRGTLRAKQEQLRSDAVDGVGGGLTTSQIKARVAKELDKLNENHGVKKDYNAFNDNFDRTEVDIDDVMKLHEEKDLDEWQSHQGFSKDDSFKSDEDFDADVKEKLYAGENTSYARGRWEASSKIVELMGQYDDAKKAEDGAKVEIEKIDAQIEDIDESIELQRAGLTLEIDGKHIDDMITEGLASDPKLHIDEGGPLPDLKAAGASKGDKGGKGGGDKADETKGDGSKDSADNSVVSGDGTIRSERHHVRNDVDLSDKAAVVKKAQEAGLLPAANVDFDKAGNAVYTVQPGDSYWSIAASSSGGGNVDEDLWRATWSANATAFGRGATTDFSSQIINADEQVAIQGRSYEDLVKLLEQ